MGADVEVSGLRTAAQARSPPATWWSVAGRPLRAIHLAGPRVAELIDELPVRAIAMAAADGTSELHDAGELRVKDPTASRSWSRAALIGVGGG
jgi:3-phosphoshikimate 1-carboxyvinyltransferase